MEADTVRPVDGKFTATPCAVSAWLLMLRGTIAIAFGVLAVRWPGPTLLVLAGLFAAYALPSRIVSIATTSRIRPAEPKGSLPVLLGVLGGAAGICAVHWRVGPYAVLTGVLPFGLGRRMGPGARRQAARRRLPPAAADQNLLQRREHIMKMRYMLGATLACTIGALYSASGVHAQAAVDVPVAGQAVLGVTVAEERLIATGFRASKLLKMEVYNDKGEKIGRIDDLVVAPDGTLSIAVINVGGFLGMGDHRVAVPVRQFQNIAPKAVLPNASKDQLKALPKFEYA